MDGLTHDQVVDVLPDLLDGLLPLDHEHAVTAHLDGCGDCRDELAAYLVVWATDGRPVTGRYAAEDPEWEAETSGGTVVPWRTFAVLAAAAAALATVLWPTAPPEPVRLGGEEIVSPVQAPRLRVYGWNGEVATPITDGRVAATDELRASTDGAAVYGVADGRTVRLRHDDPWWVWADLGAAGRVVAVAPDVEPGQLASPSWAAELDAAGVRYRAVELVRGDP